MWQRHTAALSWVYAAAEELCIFRQTHRFENSPQSIESQSAAHNKQASEPLYLNPAAFSLRCCFKMQASHKSHFLVRCLLLLNFIWNAVLPYSRQIWLRDEGEREREKKGGTVRGVEAAVWQQSGRKGTL